MFLDTADRAPKTNDAHAKAAGDQARGLTRATWVLAGATIILGLATVALVYYTRALAVPTAG